MRSRALVTPLALAALVFALTGCQPGILAPDGSSPSPEPSVSETASAEPSESPDASADPSTSPSSDGEPTETPTQAPIGGDDAIGFTCDQVLTLEQLYDFDANFTPAGEAGRDLPAVFDSIAGGGGIVCAYRHVTSDAVLLVGVAGADSGVVTGYTNEVGIGTTAQASGDYVVAVGSTYFGSDGDASSLIEQVGSNIAG